MNAAPPAMLQNAVTKGESDLVTGTTAPSTYTLALLHLDRIDHPIFFQKTIDYTAIVCYIIRTIKREGKQCKHQKHSH